MSFSLQQEQQFSGQTWPFQPGDRTVKIHVRAPEKGITPNTGLMLVLHNWGGRYNEQHYLNWCGLFADRFNVIAISVNYLQSGGEEPLVSGQKPYDHGYLQAIDCLRALHLVRGQLKAAGQPFNEARCYTMGVSGGGTVSLMANKFAPHTFACAIDICGLPALLDEVAYGQGELDAGYSRDSPSPAFLTTDMQQIRDTGNRAHLRTQFEANPHNKVIIIHGLDDLTCGVNAAIVTYANMVDVGFRPDGHFLTQWHVDGETVTTTGHPVGARDKVTCRFADAYLLEAAPLALHTSTPNDFQRAGQVTYATTGGHFVIDYAQGPPTVAFIANGPSVPKGS